MDMAENCELDTDDPWNPIHKRNKFISNLKQYDHIFSTKDELAKTVKECRMLQHKLAAVCL